MGTSAMLDVPEQRPLAFPRPVHRHRPPHARTYTRVDGCNGAAFETVSRSLLLCGDANRALELLPDESVQTVLTSPPYWSLRDYDVEDQIGRDDSLTDYLASIVRNLREAKARLARRRHGLAQRRRRLHVGKSPLSGTGPKKSGARHGGSPTHPRRTEAEGSHRPAPGGWPSCFRMQDGGFAPKSSGTSRTPTRNRSEIVPPRRTRPCSCSRRARTTTTTWRPCADRTVAGCAPCGTYRRNRGRDSMTRPTTIPPRCP